MSVVRVVWVLMFPWHLAFTEHPVFHNAAKELKLNGCSTFTALLELNND